MNAAKDSMELDVRSIWDRATPTRACQETASSGHQDLRRSSFVRASVTTLWADSAIHVRAYNYESLILNSLEIIYF